MMWNRPRVEVLSLGSIVHSGRENWRFEIPVYQRPYVWDEQVRVFLDDILALLVEDDDREMYLGSMLLLEKSKLGDRPSSFEVIDGQQRLTALWLTAAAWSGSDPSDLRRFLFLNGAEPKRQRLLRLSFPIREATENLLRALADPDEATRLGQYEHEEHDHHESRQLSYIRETYDRASAMLSQYPDDAEHLAEILLNRVKFVATIVPPTENQQTKLFEIVNDRGAQLEPHDILKARLLERIPELERRSYELLWKICSDMDAFVDDSIHQLGELTGDGPRHHYARTLEGGEPFPAVASGSLIVHNLQEILDSDRVDTAGSPEVDPDATNRKSRVDSVTSFPLLLLHTLRIWRCKRPVDGDITSLDDRKLNATFDTDFFELIDDSGSRGEEVKSFIRLLGRLRVLYDDHVVKWGSTVGDRRLELYPYSKKDTEDTNVPFQRVSEGVAPHELAMLQTMLHHALGPTRQNWLSPFLAFLDRELERELADPANPHLEPSDRYDRAFSYLRWLDDRSHGRSSESTGPKEMTYMALRAIHGDHPLKTPEAPKPEQILRQDRGVYFPHYWFYKLEFVLWKDDLQVRRDDWRSYRITSKTSVEHVWPRNPRNLRDRDDPKVSSMLDRFGNLALVTPSMNAEASNASFEAKRERFRERKRNSGRPESLKLDLIYDSEQWDDASAKKHEDEMVDALAAYYQASEAAL